MGKVLEFKPRLKKVENETVNEGPVIGSFAGKEIEIPTGAKEFAKLFTQKEIDDIKSELDFLADQAGIPEDDAEGEIEDTD